MRGNVPARATRTGQPGSMTWGRPARTRSGHAGPLTCVPASAVGPDDRITRRHRIPRARHWRDGRRPGGTGVADRIGRCLRHRRSRAPRRAHRRRNDHRRSRQRHPTRQRFQVRCRVLAALTTATVIIEAAAPSGALTTARHAKNLSRPLMAVPGPVTSAQSAGCHTIIRDLSAILVTSVDDIIAASLRPQATDRAA